MQATAGRLTAKVLDWDTAHFGLPVGCVTVGPNDSGLAEALTRAAEDGLKLVYVFTPPDFVASADLLHRFDGLKVDERVVFTIDLDGRASESAARESVVVVEAPIGEPSRALVELALAAGVYSRFAVDPRIPADAFHRLYEIWIARSCFREAADVVFIAEGLDGSNEPLGLATASVRDGDGVIGLVAVSPRARRQGVGRAMMRRVYAWLEERGVPRASVATQEANAPACALYRACGCQPSHRETIYHFWPRGTFDGSGRSRR